jgi:hypothetical protein
MTDGFDFESWLEEAQNGLETLKAKREALVAKQEGIRIALEDTDKEIGALASMLDAYIGSAPKADEVPKTRATRTTGIKKAAKSIAEELTIGVDWTIDKLVTMIQEMVPGAPEKSCRSAIQALAKEGVYKLNPDATEQSYSTTLGLEPTPQQVSLLEGVEGAEVIVVGTAEVITFLTKKMKERTSLTSLTIGDKNIGWIAADLHCDPKIVRDALKIMVDGDGDYEFAYEGETKVLRRKAEPGSKEELKRTHIKDQPLFPDADRPPHA